MHINSEGKTAVPPELRHKKLIVAMRSTIRHHVTLLYCTCLAITITILINHNVNLLASAISIKPADFDHLIMPCYLGGGSSSSAYSSSSAAQSQSLAQNPISSSSNLNNPVPNSYSGQGLGRTNTNWQNMPSSSNGNGGSQPSYYASQVDSGRSNGQTGFSYLGQQIPRAHTIDNFIALVSKIETANPRLANNLDQLIKVLLGRFRMDNYYYDVQTRTPIIDQDHRTLNIVPAILNPMGQGQQSQFMLASDTFPEHLLDHDEKCSMYFMLSHFIDKSASSSLNSPSSMGAPVPQLTGPMGGQRPPSLQAAGSGYPALSANAAFSGGSRYPGPSPSFGSPLTKNMNSFGSGINTNPEYAGSNPYGMNVPQPNTQFNQNYNNVKNSGQYSGTLSSNTKYSTPLIDGNARARDERQATEYGVVTVGNQENAAIVLNRVLMGILAAATPPQTIRQLASTIYQNQPITSTPKIDEELEPLFAVTLADLWAVSSIAKAGKAFDFRMLGDNGHWNNTICPTSFYLERSNSIRFTTAELIGGLDGFSLGMFRRRLLSMRKNMRLSEMLRMYYSKTGFRPQFVEGVCNRGTVINTQLDDLHRQAENYLRLYQLNLPISDNEVAISINRVESFKEMSKQVANQYAPPEICQDSSFNDPYPMNQQDQCEIAKADIVTVLDTSPQANEAFMHLVVTKLAQKLGLSRQGNSFSILTNQQDTSGYAGAYSFNALIRNSTNTAEIGCSLAYDTSKTYQGGQVTDPTRIIEMFERALVNLDSEYLIRQTQAPTSTYRPPSYVSSLFGQSDNLYGMNGAGPKNVGGAKVIIWFNYGSQMKTASVGSNPTNWNGPNYSDQNQYKFYEAKKYLRENYRGAAILAIANNRDDVKNLVYDEERDILTDIPPGDSGASLSSSDYSYQAASDPSAIATLSGPADQLVNKLVQRMCDVPAVFQYPMCFRAPSDNVLSLGYISPGRRQYWMMSPKTFFASRTVRMAFKVEGGRLKVCFGRMAKPDESAQRNSQSYQSGSISFANSPQSGSSGPNQPSTSTSSSSNNYYTGLENGICKDVSPGQEIDFIVDDPCYKKPIAECEPFYYVIREISNPGEMDHNYMCKDEGCKRFDQVKFMMTHSGVVCSGAFKTVRANWFLITFSIITTLVINNDIKLPSRKFLLSANKGLFMSAAFVCGSMSLIAQQVQAQQAGVNDFGAGRSGEKRGNLTPLEILAITLLIMTILAGLALTVGLCYYVSKRNSKGMEKVEQDDY